MKKIKLSNRNQYVLIDNEDFKWAYEYKWSLQNGYAKTWINGRNMPMHRLLMNCPVNKEVDHINVNKLDNRKKNLRICTREENCRNTNIQKNNTSGFKGVYWFQNRYWRAKIQFKNKRIHLGFFRNKIDAAKAYNEAAKIYFGEFARLNYV